MSKPRSHQSWLFGTLWIGAAIAAPVLGTLCAIRYAETAEMGCETYIVGAMFLAVFCFRRGRKRLARSAVTVLAADTRPPVLYLRPFATDKIAAAVPGRHFGNAGVQLLYLLLSSPSRATQSLFVGSEEEQLADVFGQIGPFIAVGDPSETLTALGASRLYLSNTEWQQRVHELLERAALVVFGAGQTPSSWWEIEQARTLVTPRQILVLIPAFWDYTTYAPFKKRLDELLHTDLPPLPTMKAEFGSAGAILFFDEEWKASIVAIRRKDSFLPPDKKMAEALVNTLGPVFAARFPEWRERLGAKLEIRKQRLAVVSMGLLCYFVFFPVAEGIAGIFPNPEVALRFYELVGIIGFFGALVWLFAR
jgi:hypothetical protein